MFQPFRTTAMENLAAMADMTEVAYRSKTLPQLKEMIARYHAQKTAFLSIPRTEDVGIIRVSSESAKEMLRPSPARCLEVLGALLPRVAAYSNSTLLAEISESLRVRWATGMYPVAAVGLFVPSAHNCCYIGLCRLLPFVLLTLSIFIPFPFAVLH